MPYPAPPERKMPVARALFKIRSFTGVPWALAAAVLAEPVGPWGWLGLALVVAGEALRLWAVGHIGPESRVTREGPTAPRLVTSGPYGWLRNPLYLANVVIVAGLALWSGALFPWLPAAAFAFFVWQYTLLSRLEDYELERRFGWEFLAYRNAVPLWLPRFTPHPLRLGGRWDIRPAFRGELRSILSAAVILFACRASVLIKSHFHLK